MPKRSHSAEKQAKESRPAVNEDRYPTDRPPRERANRLKRGLILSLVVIAVLAFFAPQIVVNTALKQRAIDWALRDFKGKVTVESVQCGWFSDTEITGVSAIDPQGQVLFSVESIKLPRSLLALLSTTNYGMLEIGQPVVHWQIRTDGSNLEDAFAAFLSLPQTPAGPAPTFAVKISDAKVFMADVASKREFLLDQIQAQFEANQPDKAPMQIQLQGLVANRDGTGQGSLVANVVLDAGKADLNFENGFIELKAETLPLDLTTPILTRFIEPIAVSGEMNGTVNAQWSGPEEVLSADFDSTTFDRVIVNMPNRLPEDEIRLSQARIQGHLSVNSKKLTADRFEGYTDVGWLKADGEMNWEQMAAASAVIPANNFQAEGTLNVAPLVSMLPNTIPLQSGIRMESGTIQFNASSRVEGADRRLVFNLESSGLTAQRNGKRLNWDKPARIVAAIRQTHDNSVFIESLNCRTNFLTLSGSANRSNGDFKVGGDLAAALDELNQIFDLGDLEIAGKINGELAWQFDGFSNETQKARPLRAGGKFHVESPRIVLPEQAAWSENELDIVFQLAGQRLPQDEQLTRPIRIDAAKLELINQNQTFNAELAEPLINPSWNSTWKFTCALGGEIKAWVNQIGALSALDVTTDGTVHANARVTIQQGQQVWVQGMTYECQDLYWDGCGVTVMDPEVGGQIEAGYEIATGKIQVTDATIASSSISGRVQNLLVDSKTGAITGQVAFLADINRCLKMLNPNPTQTGLQWFGRANGSITLASNAGDDLNSSLALDLTDLVAAEFRSNASGVQNVSTAGSWVRVFEQDHVSLRSAIQLSQDFSEVSLQDARLISPALEARVSGKISDLQGDLVTEIQGNWQPNWQQLKPLVDASVGGLTSLEGVSGGGFQMQGPILNAAAGQAGQPWLNPGFKLATTASWQSGQVLGLPVGSSQLELQVAEGLAVVRTSEIPFSNGVMRLAPQLDLRTETTTLYMTPGKILEQVEMTPEICREWLQYVAPVIAGATTAQGRVSVSVDRAQVPLERFELANVQGTVLLHEAGVGPGPVGQQLVQAVQRIKALAQGKPFSHTPAAANAQWLVFPPQQVGFVVQNGRVYNQGIEFRIEDIVIRTSGSVGLDHSMDMVAEIPVLPHWVGQGKLGSHLSGKSIKIPIRGTIHKPQLDGSIFKSLTQNLLKDSAGRFINQELQGLENDVLGGLQGIFGNGK